MKTNPDHDQIFGRILKALTRYTGRTSNFNVNLGFKKGPPDKPDVSCTLFFEPYANTIHGTATHVNGHALPEEVQGQWYGIGPQAHSPNMHTYVTGWGDTIIEALLDAEALMHQVFSQKPPRATL